MFIFINLENIILGLEKVNIFLDIELLSEIQKSYLLIGGNVFYLITWIFILNVSYKILLKLLKWFF